MMEVRTYRNQSIDLQNKSMDWFLYDRGFCHERVKQMRNTSQIVNISMVAIQHIREFFTKRISERGRITTKNAYSISIQCFISIAPENARKQKVYWCFKVYRYGKLKAIGFSWSVDFRLRPKNGIYRLSSFSTSLHLFKFNNRNARTTSEICQQRRSGVLLLTWNRFYTLFWRFVRWLWTGKC